MMSTPDPTYCLIYNCQASFAGDDERKAGMERTKKKSQQNLYAIRMQKRKES